MLYASSLVVEVWKLSEATQSVLKSNSWRHLLIEAKHGGVIEGWALGDIVWLVEPAEAKVHARLPFSAKLAAWVENPSPELIVVKLEGICSKGLG